MKFVRYRGIELIEGNWQIAREPLVDCANGPCQWQVEKVGDAVVSVTSVVSDLSDALKL